MARIIRDVLLSVLALGIAAFFVHRVAHAQLISSYADDVTLPSCDVTLSSGDSLAALNGGSRVYCLQAGTYSGVVITASGTAANPKVLRFYDPARPNEHIFPWKENSSNRATVTSQIEIQGDHWIFTGISFNKASGTERLVDPAGGTDLLFDRLLVEGGGTGGGQVRLETRNKLQTSVLRNTAKATTDIHSLVIGGSHDDVEVVGNEIYNNDGDMLQIHAELGEDILIADNDMYQEPGWNPLESEQGMDFKNRTGTPIANGMRILNNRIFDITQGPSNNNTAGKYTGDDRTGNVLWEGNIIDNLDYGFQGSGDPATNTFRHNLFYNVGRPWSIRTYTTAEIYYNTIINADQEWIGDSPKAATNIDIRCNVLIDSGTYDPLGGGTEADFNAYYNSAQYAAPGTHDVLYGSSSSANMNQFCYERKRLTGPETRCIPTATNTASSPHINMCANCNIGGRSGIGIDDSIYTYAAAGADEDVLRQEGEPPPPPPSGVDPFASVPGCKLTLEPPFFKCGSVQFSSDCIIATNQTVPSGITTYQDICDTVTIADGVTLTVNGSFLYPDLLGDPPTYDGLGQCVGTGCN